MARRHVFGHGRVMVIAAGAQMDSDPLALEKDLDGARRQPDLDLAPGKAVGDAVKMRLDLDMVIDADPPQPPFGILIGFGWQRLEMRPLELLEQRPAGDPKPAVRRSSLSWRSNSGIAALSSARL
jgi:hypothetical protein